jgi:hypothetical protein
MNMEYKAVISPGAGLVGAGTNNKGPLGLVGHLGNRLDVSGNHCP